jgi:hypothetical protein
VIHSILRSDDTGSGGAWQLAEKPDGSDSIFTCSARRPKRKSVVRSSARRRARIDAPYLTRIF